MLRSTWPVSFMKRAGPAIIANAATFSPNLKASEIVLSNGNRTVAHGATNNAYQHAMSPDAKASGKWYCEVTVDHQGSTTGEFGVALGNYKNPMYGTNIASNAWATMYLSDGRILNTANPSTTSSTYTTGDVIGVAYDADAGTVAFRKNGGAWTSTYTIGDGGPYALIIQTRYTSAQATVNFGQSAFLYNPPAGYSPWSARTRGGRYFRVFQRVGAGSFPTEANIAEMALRLTSGGADQVGSGTASASTEYSGTYAASKAVDANNSTFWVSGAGAGNLSWWQYDFGSGVSKAIVEAVHRLRNDASQYPQDMAYAESDDGTNFFPLYRNGANLSWTTGEVKTFTFQ